MFVRNKIKCLSAKRLRSSVMSWNVTDSETCFNWTVFELHRHVLWFKLYSPSNKLKVTPLDIHNDKGNGSFGIHALCFHQS